MIRRILAALACLTLLGCSAPPEPSPQPSPAPRQTSAMPVDGVALASFGFQNAPEGFMVPSSSVISDRVDQTNTVVAVFTAPSGLELAAFLRQYLAADGWRVTADAQNSLLFERGELRGAFTVSGSYAALSIRSDGGS